MIAPIYPPSWGFQSARLRVSLGLQPYCLLRKSSKDQSRFQAWGRALPTGAWGCDLSSLPPLLLSLPWGPPRRSYQSQGGICQQDRCGTLAAGTEPRPRLLRALTKGSSPPGVRGVSRSRSGSWRLQVRGAQCKSSPTPRLCHRQQNKSSASLALSLLICNLG